eukprot:TRINITY_DN35470_c0_g1_i1.p1 TRINITY_DN35470_c0_g1~~TRINITY_DN35470_c0_g1_i1.p1  ORF type:complete len:162 (-),score=13.06 TRINITY_DN35470_c0_g1_i1:90-575(-)
MPKPSVGKKKALIASKAVSQGVNTKQKKKVRTNVHFFRPKTLKLDRKPKFPRRSIAGENKMDQYRIIRHPLTSESAMRKIEDQNTLVFIVDVRANKHQIRDAIFKMYQIKAAKVNTLIRTDGSKKAFVRLTSDFDALDVANTIGLVQIFYQVFFLQYILLY